MAKPDDRSDNVEKLQNMVQNTIENLEEAHETLQNSSLSKEQKQDILAKNKKREESIRGFRKEIKDEYRDLH
ncbi:small acid-soluble spore protein Tlp [Desulforamulus aeronauticus]|uniref:Protein Tlp homolog n=1 Tax=Desulforamulus aeronauticus DSM 10349 TaxID=1121421 RepID=A0A1M6NE17_9FIRM|nr:small acid-soluble spore protein Tlp [Desulforamulus aeronauticus]SHJ93859.1 small acid-soluble spore protein (thioredoxin-like protein) [Desulforamulus aeronauticus DSM 10349]